MCTHHLVAAVHLGEVSASVEAAGEVAAPGDAEAQAHIQSREEKERHQWQALCDP
jgi:hypothetical protein